MDDKDLVELTDPTTLHSKRGARKRLNGKIEMYYNSIYEVPAEHFKEPNIRRQLAALEGYVHTYRNIQEIIIELLSDQDPDRRMEKEETEFKEQNQAHDTLKGNLETLLQSSIVYSWDINLLDGLTEMEDMDNFEGAPHVQLIEEINTDFKNLDLSGISTGLKAPDDIKKLRRDISRRIHVIMI